ncbi:NADAR family protein [Kordiimonas pumila]|uniref:NADAR family protein n=1 Tax=Kordiimonas pumila TaxID=2161677 RepID=A0ABV7D3U0_9PROT|nr:NADAR family protein [Kordiimonas pumila]
MAIFFNTRGEHHSEFKNSSAHGIKLDGVYWRSVAHYVEAQRFSCPEVQEKVRKSPYAFAARSIARAVPDALRDDWFDVRDRVMEKAVRAKFEAHAELRAALCATGKAEIIDGSVLGTYWGAGAGGTGQNKLGKIMMKIRDELSDE